MPLASTSLYGTRKRPASPTMRVSEDVDFATIQKSPPSLGSGASVMDTTKVRVSACLAEDAFTRTLRPVTAGNVKLSGKIDTLGMRVPAPPGLRTSAAPPGAPLKCRRDARSAVSETVTGCLED